MKEIGGKAIMNNTSINQLHKEIETARQQALNDPYRYEREDQVVGSYAEGNSLSDMVVLNEGSPYVQSIDPVLKVKIEQLFESFPTQYDMLGLYYAAEFTVGEIAMMQGVTKQSVQTTLKRAKKRLIDGLTAAEYDSIRWLMRDFKPIAATSFEDWSEYETSNTCQDREQFPYHKKVS